MVVLVAALAALVALAPEVWASEDALSLSSATAGTMMGLRRRLTRGSDVLLQVPLIDGHNKLPTNLRALVQNKLSLFDFKANLSMDPIWSCPSCHTDLPRLRAGRVGGQFWVSSVPCTSQYRDAVEMTLEQIDVIKRLVEAYPNDLKLVTTSAGIEKAFKEGKIASLIAVEGGHSIDSRLGVLRLFAELGVRYLTLTHSCSTPWAKSSLDEERSPPVFDGLTPFGERVVLELNRLGVMVDLSHVSAPTMRDALRVSRAPIIFSHSSARAICDHLLGVPDDVLHSVAANNGVVMVNFFSETLACWDRIATLEDAVVHINHIRLVAGVEHVGIGADFDSVHQMPWGLDDVSHYPELFDRLAENRPGEPVWTEDDLKKLAGLNLLRVFRDVELVRDELEKQGVGPDEEWLPTSDLLSHPTECLSI